MKRRITYGLLTILLIGGIYFVLRFTFGLFTPFNFWTAGRDIQNGEIQITKIGEIPLNFRQKQKLANSYGINFYLLGCNVSTDIINGSQYYNKKMIDHLERKLGSGWWSKFQSQLDSIDNLLINLQDPAAKRLSFKDVAEITADSSHSIWVEKHGNSFSLALRFQYKDTLAVSYSPECWLIYPYKLIENKIVVYWDKNIDTKYDFDIVKAINKTDQKYIGKPFMVLELENDTTFKATYPLKDLVRNINSSSKKRTFFPDRFNVVQDGEMYD